MRTPALVVAIAAAVLALAGCASQGVQPRQPSSPTATKSRAATPTSTPEAAVCPPTPLNVTIEYELKDDGAGGILVNATTNLPEGTDLQASFYSPTTRFLAQDPQTVTGGRATFGPFADHGSPLHGAYDFSITAPIARNQPPAVQDCIGHTGEQLTGPLVKQEELTGDFYASVDVPVVVP